MQFDDYLQIRNLMNRYAHLMDQAKIDEVAQLFAHADVHFPGGTVFRSDVNGLAAFYRKWNKIYEDTGTPRTRHVTTNVILEDDGPNRAKSQAYVVVFQATPAFPLQPVIAGTYLDRFEKVDGKWRFAERVESDENFELLGDLTQHLAMIYEPTLA
jgi:3-phenylpropionate/cinnamic acid dioxygenase small subunit